MTAIVVIGRSGSAFAAEIGTMKVTEEIDALNTMALNPIQFLVTPKFLAMVVMMPCLTTWADFMGILGGSLFGISSAGFTFGSYIRATMDALLLRDVITGLIKSVMFGMVITAVGCHEGFRTGAGAEEVGRSTTAAVVMSIFLVVWWIWCSRRCSTSPVANSRWNGKAPTRRRRSPSRVLTISWSRRSRSRRLMT
jgi:phospholipid/cholesterol/gamma-HCH transport system permease protein